MTTAIGRKTRSLYQLLFDGQTYNPKKDGKRLETALFNVANLMSDEHWRTLESIATKAKCSEAGASARLRDLRKDKFGSHTVERRRVKGADGLWEYRVFKDNKHG